MCPFPSESTGATDGIAADTPTVRLLRRIAQRSPHLFALLALAFILLFLAVLRYPRADGHLISGDGIFYYATMRSALLDGDVRVVNDLALANARVPPNAAFHGFRIEEAYVFPIGPSILWSPFFLTGHGLAVLYYTVGGSVKIDGFSWIDESFVCVAGILYGCLGLYFTFRLVSRWVPEEIALVAVLATFAASSAFYYVAIENWLSHTLEIFSLPLFFAFALAERDFKVRDFVVSGFLLALVFLVRWQDVLFGVVLLRPLVRLYRGSRNPILALSTGCVTLAFSFILGASLQFWYWSAIFGTYLTIPQGSGFIDIANSHPLAVLFSTLHGLITWTPIALIGFIGLLFLPRQSGLLLLFTVSIALQVILCGAVSDWWAGDAFGQRRLVNLFPLLCIGVALCLERVKATWYQGLTLALCGGLVLWNGLFMLQYALGRIPRQGYLTFHQLVIDKFVLLFDVLPKYLPVGTVF
jgi:hypothetical protein